MTFNGQPGISWSDPVRCFPKTPSIPNKGDESLTPPSLCETHPLVPPLCMKTSPFPQLRGLLSPAPRAPVTSSEGSCPLLGGMLPEAESLNKASVIFKFAPFNFRCLNVGRKN